MTAPIQQGWVFCTDGYGWLQRLTAVGVLGPQGLCLDLTELTAPPEPAEAWEALPREDGWYVEVPAQMINDLAELHGGIVDGLSSRLDLQLGNQAD